MEQKQNRSQWSSQLIFILATTGSAVGLGNIWKFPYMTGVNGGGAFVLIYLMSIVAIVLPLFLVELYIGQQSQKNVVHSFEALHKEGSSWQGVGVLAVVTAFLIMSFYGVAGGWVLDFSYRALINEFGRLENSENIKTLMTGLFANPWRLLFWHFVFMVISTGIVIGGIEKGLERWNKILMPGLIVILLTLLAYSCFLSGFGEAMIFLFKPDFSKITGKIVLEAVGQAFFSLSLAMGIVITYGSYFQKSKKPFKVAISVGVLDTLIAILAGIVVFSVVFSYGFEPGGGPTLIFQTLPVLFAKMPGGYFVALAFFLLVTFAAITSAISIMEVIITFWIEKFNMSRKKSTIIVASSIFFMGVFCALSFNVLSQFKIFGLTIFDLFDKVTSSVFLPLGGVLTALFFGWVLKPKLTLALFESKRKIGLSFLWLMRTIVPVALLVMLIKGLMEW